MIGLWVGLKILFFQANENAGFSDLNLFSQLFFVS